MIHLPPRDIDPAVLLMRLRRKLDLSNDELAELTGYSISYIEKVITEINPGNEIVRAIRLLGLYTLNVPSDVPLMGDHHPDF
jgi:predicted transcriptional regulator